MVVSVGSIVKSSAQPYGDYSIQIVVDNSSQTFSHFSNIVFANEFFGQTPTIAFDNCCDAYALPPSSGQPMIYTTITPTPPGTNEFQFNTRPPLTANWSVPLGFDAGNGVTDDFTFTVEWLYTVPGNIGVELEDLQLGTTQDLVADNTYEFSGSHTDPEARFMVHFTLLAECPSPEMPSFSNIGTEQVDVSWTCNNCVGGETFILEYGPAGYTPGNSIYPGVGGTVINPAVSGLTVSGLDSGTDYDFYVRTDCETSYSENSAAGSVSTLACPTPDVANYTFINDTSALIQFNCATCIGTETIYLEYGLNGFVPGTDSLVGEGTVIQVQSSQTMISPLNPGTTYDVYFRVECDSAFSDNSEELILTTLGGDCATPELPVVSNVVGTSFDVSWTCNDCTGGETFIVEYGLEGHVPGVGVNPGAGGTVVQASNSPVSISGVLPESVYVVYVRTVCSGPSYSSNNGPAYAETGEGPCPVPGAVSASAVTETTADISWTCNNCTGGEQFLIEYGAPGFTPGTGLSAGGGTVIQGAVSIEQLTGLTPNTEYDLYVRTRCGASDFSDNSSVVNFETLSNCPVPENLVVTSTTGSTAVVEWTCNSCVGGEQFFLEFGPFNFPNNGSPFDVVTPAVSPQTITGLTPGMQLSVHVQTYCGGGSYSDYTDLVHFIASDTCILDLSISDQNICLGEEVQFTDQSSGSASWSWEFGDGATSSFPNPAHTYQDTGSYDVTLTITNGGNCTDDTTIVGAVTVHPQVIAAFTADSTLDCVAPHDLQFTDQSTGANSWSWDFDDQTVSSDQNPNHTYSGVGTYNVELTASNSVSGCSDVTSMAIEVNEAPVASFSHSENANTATFNNTSIGGSTYHWDFGDGNSSTMENPTHTYAGGGIYTVLLTVTNNCGTDTISDTVIILIVDVLDPTGISDLKVYPNPTGGRTRIQAIVNTPINTLNVEILDMSGRIVWQDISTNHSGYINAELDLSDLSEGLYQLQLTSGNHRILRKISIQR